MRLVVIHFVVVCRRQQTPPLIATSVINLPRFVADECIALAARIVHSTRWGHISAKCRDFCLLHLHLTPPLKCHRRNIAIRKEEALLSQRPRDASCLSVVSFNIRTAQFFITSYCGFELLVHKILLWLGYPMMKKFRRYLYSF